MDLGMVLALSLLSFLVTLVALPSWIQRARDRGLMGRDVHKEDVEVAEMGGVAVLLGITLALTTYIAVETFYMAKNPDSTLFVLAAPAREGKLFMYTNV
jgi:UDP-N-acetylmuramyl pentapeptide phosphotransferase/UDP-N-acetylglucosamine-1-phosphate transferase